MLQVLMPQSKTGASPAENKVNSRVIIAMIILISSLMASSMVYHFLRSDNFVAQLSSDWGIGLFIALAVIPFGTAYYLFRKFINPINKNLMATNSTSSYFRLSYNVLKFAFFSNVAFLAIITVQIISVSEFNLGITILSLQANSVLVTILFTYLSYKFLSWFRSSHDLAVLFLGLAFAFIAIGTAATDAAQTTFFLLDNPGRIEEPASSQGISYDPSVNLKSDPLLHDIFLAIQFPLRIAFVFYWLATVMLLHKYSKSIGKVRFWSLVTLPLATFIIASIFIYSGIGSVLLRGVISSTTALVAGILFGVIFLTIARALGSTRPQKEKDKQLDSGRTVSQYLMMSVFGTILFLVVSTPPNHIIDWMHVPFPPFADVVWMFMGFAAYLYSFGLYFSTISISHDVQLRKSIQQLSTTEASLLHGLGTTQMQQEIQKRVLKLSMEQEEALKEQTGVEEHLSESEIQQYVSVAMEEIQKSRK